MLAMAFVPALAQALQSSPFAGIGVCSTPGTLPAGGAGGMPPGQCPLCTHVFDGPAGPTVAEAEFGVTIDVVAARQAGSDHLPPQRHAWAFAPARAPPPLFL